MKIVVLSPHRDDAAFSLGLTIQSWLEAGHAVNVVNCFTQSEYAPFADDALVGGNQRTPAITALRSAEDQRWRQQNGAGLTLTDLNLIDAPLRLHCTLESVCGLPLDEADEVMSKIKQGIKQAGALDNASAMVLPLALGGHVDHKTTREAALPASTATMPRAFYEDLPYAARPGVAETIQDTALAIDHDLAPVFVTEESDAQAAVQRKRRAAHCYESQMDECGMEQIAQFCQRYGGRERLWANAAWRRSALGAAGVPRQGVAS